VNDGAPRSELQLSRDRAGGQVFVPWEDKIRAVELFMRTNATFGVHVTLNILSMDGRVLGSQTQFLPRGDEDWLTFVFSEAVPVTPGQAYRLEASSESGTTMWSCTYDSYPLGLSYEVNSPSVQTFSPLVDTRFRVNYTDFDQAAGTATAIAMRASEVPPTMTSVAATTISSQATEAAIMTATAIPRATKSAALGIPPDQVDQLVIGLAGSVSDRFQAMPGDSLPFRVGSFECCYMFVPFEGARPIWSVTPSQGASINPETGVLTVDKSAENGQSYVVTANLGNGALQLTTPVHVYTLEGNPLVGVWREEAQLNCTTGQFIAAEPRMGELLFRADGSFSATWFPFEVYVDYSGAYEFDIASKALRLTPRSVNYLPPDIKPSGTFRFDEQGRLILEGLWLGRPPQTAPDYVIQCGYRFELVGRSTYR
jgi:hypothetical protein